MPTHDSSLSPIDQLLATIVADCGTTASAEVKANKEKQEDFDPNRYLTDPTYKIDNYTTREWYNSFIGVFDQKWKEQLENKLVSGDISLEEFAKICFEVRHHARMFTRAHMADQAGLVSIQQRDFATYGNQDGPDFNFLVTKERTKQMEEHEAQHPGEEFTFDPTKAYTAIIGSSTRTNLWVNRLKELGLLELGSAATKLLEHEGFLQQRPETPSIAIM